MLRYILLSAFCLGVHLLPIYAQTLSPKLQAPQLQAIAPLEYVQFDQQNAPQIPIAKNKGSRVVLPNTGGIEAIFLSALSDDLGMTHYRYQQTYAGIPIEGTVYILHANKNDRIEQMNGSLVEVSARHLPATTPQLHAEQALQYALHYTNAQVYREHQALGLVYVPVLTDSDPLGNANNPSQADKRNSTLRLCYKCDIYAKTPLSRQYVFVDAQNGDIIMAYDRLCTGNSNGTAHTKYSGIQPIITDSIASNNFLLRETARGGGVFTYNCQQTTNYSYTNFTDSNNIWNTVNAQQDEAALDAHWGAEKTYDYYLLEHSRNSIDNNNMPIESHVHYDVNYFNAFWDGQRMTYGDGSGSATALTCLDIVAHELTHGVTEYSAGLNSVNESGALNEAFSDIFGTAVEFYAKPATANWLVGNEIGVTLRSMSNPNAYGDPDTYNGTNWYVGSGDNGGVHTNSGVANFWFYLLSIGGSGTNDLGNAYTVSGISVANAAKIAYRTLTVYLTPTSNYANTRFYSIQAAIDLFGACSPQVIATTNAWYAVGVGTQYDGIITADFTANATSACAAPLTVQFSNSSSNASSYLWDFGDGSTSTLNSPTHTYTANGNYDVRLIADAGTCGRDTLIRSSYISIQPNNPCIYNMPASGTAPGAISACSGTLYDAGGMSANYFDNVVSVQTIAPTNAATVSITFQSFDLEADYDYLYIYNGLDDQAPNIGIYTGTTLPNGGNAIVATSGAITIKLVSDPYVTGAGFRLNWTCTPITTKPLAQFETDVRTSCSGNIRFYDRSTNSPSAYLWDFGDGTSSTLANPAHIYAQNGTYSVTLQATNSFGTDDTLYNNYITISRPTAPSVTNDTICAGSSGTVQVVGTGVFNWYASPQDTATVLTQGNSYTSPILNDTTQYYAEQIIVPATQKVGPVSNAIGTGGMFGLSNRYTIFSVYQPCRLKSVKVYANGGFNRTIQLRNSSGFVLQDTSIYINSGESRIPLNFDLPVATNLQLATAATSEMYRNSAGAVFPYTLPGIVSITGTSAPAGYYYFFYDWEIELPTCVSPKSTATIVVKPLPTPPVAGDDAPCPLQTMSYTVPSPNPNSSYEWTIVGGIIVSGQNTPTITVIWNDGITSGSVAVTESRP